MPSSPVESSTSTIMDDDEKYSSGKEGPHEDAIGEEKPPKRDSVERALSSNGSAKNEIFADQAATDEDLEKNAKPAGPVAGGVNPADFPDGGLEACLVVAGAFCSMFCSFGWINAIGVFQQYYQTDLLREYSASAVSWIPSLEVFFMFLGSPVYGKIFDNYGPRYLLLTGSFLHVFGLMMTSLSTQYYQILLSQGVVSALGCSAIFASGVSSVGTWFFRNRAGAFGVMAAGSSLGGVIYPIMVSRLIPRIGFPWTMRVCAFLIMGMITISNFTVKSRLKPNPRPLVLMEFIRPLKEPAFTLVCIASFLYLFGMFLPFNYLIVQSIEIGMSPYLASYLIPILNAVSIFGRIIPGIIADRVGRFNVMIVTSLFSTILVLALWLPAHGNVPIILFAILYGFATGAFVSLGPALIAQISPIQQIGVRNGSYFLFVALAGLTGNPIGGALIAHDHGSFLYLQLFCGLTMAAGTVFFVASRYVQVKWKLTIV